MQIGIWLPSYTYPGLSYERVRGSVHDYSKRCNELGYDIWVIDHLLHAPGLYGMSWLEPLHVLTYAAAVAPDVTIGTGILVLPLRHPVMLAKEVATIDLLTGGRYRFGIGPGWYPGEFAATGTSVKERGARTDEILAAVRRLLTEDHVTFEGRYYRFEDVTIEPRPPKFPEVWVSGGSRLPDPEYSDLPVLADSVLERILAADWWLSRNSGTQEFIRRDWEKIQAALAERGRPADSVRFAHCNFVYLVETSDREQALEAQKPYFLEVMGTHRPWEQLQQSYLLGSLDEILARLVELKEMGVEYLVLAPTSDEPEQLELIEKHVRPALA
ncbi:MAG TPA: TIGR03619 family F420-dependent LLM class oxidoreductase [Gaiellaceae bacterium]|nr:TIGR03619 family F420-dependent LLM class oxidoreductase [Gaiellaceae bacterium]